MQAGAAHHEGIGTDSSSANPHLCTPVPCRFLLCVKRSSALPDPRPPLLCDSIPLHLPGKAGTRFVPRAVARDESGDFAGLRRPCGCNDHDSECSTPPLHECNPRVCQAREPSKSGRAKVVRGTIHDAVQKQGRCACCMWREGRTPVYLDRRCSRSSLTCDSNGKEGTGANVR